MNNKQIVEKIAELIIKDMLKNKVSLSEIQRRSGVLRQTTAQYVNGEQMRILPESVFKILDYLGYEIRIVKKDRMVG